MFFLLSSILWQITIPSRGWSLIEVRSVCCNLCVMTTCCLNPHHAQYEAAWWITQTHHQCRAKYLTPCAKEFISVRNISWLKSNYSHMQLQYEFEATENIVWRGIKNVPPHKNTFSITLQPFKSGLQTLQWVWDQTHSHPGTQMVCSKFNIPLGSGVG